MSGEAMEKGREAPPPIRGGWRGNRRNAPRQTARHPGDGAGGRQAGEDDILHAVGGEDGRGRRYRDRGPGQSAGHVDGAYPCAYSTTSSTAAMIAYAAQCRRG
jgi:hypothetical protein